MPDVLPVLHGYRLVSDQISAASLRVVCRELQTVLAAGIPGDVAEFGCYIGTTSLFLRRELNRTAGGQELHVYDSFQGLPPKSAADASPAGTAFQAGELATGKKALLKQFRSARLRPPVVHKGWFHELPASAVPRRLCFAFLDGDFYDSILASLRLTWPRLQPGGSLVMDDYDRAALPGVTRAVHDYFHGQPPRVRVEQGIGIIRT